MRSKINIGTASIILIFIILCLSVFALLSLSDAKSAEVFAKRRADSVTSFYEADSTGQSFIKAASETIKNGEDLFAAIENIKAVLPQGTSTAVNDTGNLTCDIPMPSGQSLRVELDGRDASVLSYYVYISEDYAIDTRLPLWTGDEAQ